ncbi:MAG TPA: diguanylate cyclase [Xanthomonadaceae bacterium]|jgi:diguanylate cyclase (GGDEF)-like protein
MSANPARSLAIRIVLAAAFAFAMLAAQAVPLRGYWREARGDDRPEAIRHVPESAAGTKFDPARLNAIPAGRHGAWVLLWPDASIPATTTDDDWVLQVADPGLQPVSLFPARAGPVLRADVLQPQRGWLGHGRIGFPLGRDAPAAPPIVLRMEPGRVIAPPLRFSLVSADEFRREEARWLAIATASLAIMAAMAVMALLFALELRDMTFVWYAGYVLAYAMILAVQTGYVAEPLEWTWAAAAPNAWGRAATAMSVFFATLFVARFAELARYAPRMRIAVLALGISTGVLMTLGSLPVPVLIQVSSLLINPLLILGGPIILAATLIAGWRGSRYAGFFLLGWTPLLAITVLGSAQVFGVLSTWTWLGDASFVAGAFEALVLSLGLADRALALRHDRDIAQAQADTDALTSVFNRRGLDRRIAKLVESAHRLRRPLTVLFLDLDRFKLLNDRQGHAAGDAALVAVTRLMRADMRAHDLLGRYGGEEFLAALPGCDLDAALTIAERIRADLRVLGIAVESVDDALTASLGVASLERGDDAPSLIERADQAMYAAKRAGGNRVSTEASSNGPAATQTG